MENNNKKFFSTENTIKLIKMVHNNTYTAKFENAEGHPINTANVWKEILGELKIENFTYNDIKNKYNIIYTKYKKEKQASKKSGASRPTWKYFDIFDETIPIVKQIVMESVEELGVPKIIEPEVARKKIKKSSEKNEIVSKKSLMEKKNKLYDLMIENMGTDSEVKKLKTEVGEMKNILNEILKKINEDKK